MTRRVTSSRGSSSRKRSASPVTSQETTVIKKRARRNSRPLNPHRPRASNYEYNVRQVIGRACNYYAVLICTLEPFPDEKLEMQMASEAWTYACDEFGVDMELEADIRKLITARASTVRGALKTIARSIVISEYGLAKALTKGPHHVRGRVVELITRLRFAFTEPKSRKGFLQHLAIQGIIDLMWYRATDDDGVVFRKFFDRQGFNIATLALVLTAIRACLDEWERTGTQQAQNFEGTRYSKVYKKYLHTISKAAKEHKNYMQKVRMNISQLALRRLGVSDQEEIETELSADDLAALDEDDVPDINEVENVSE